MCFTIWSQLYEANQFDMIIRRILQQPKKVSCYQLKTKTWKGYMCIRKKYEWNFWIYIVVECIT